MSEVHDLQIIDSSQRVSSRDNSNISKNKIYDDNSMLDEVDDEIDLREIIDIFLRNKTVIISLTLISMMLSLLLVFSQVPVYQATAMIKIEMDGEKLAHFDHAVEDTPLPGLLFFNAQLELLKSHRLGERVLAQLNEQLDTDLQTPGTEQDKASLVSRIQGALNTFRVEASSFLTGGVSKEMADKAGKAPPVMNFINHISLKTNKTEKDGSTIVRVNFDSIDPVLAAQSVNLLVKELMEMDIERRQSRNSDGKKYLQKQLLLTKKRLEDSERELAKYSEEKEIFQSGSDKSLISRSVEELSKAYLQSREDLIDAEGEYKQRKEVSGEVLMMTHPALFSLRERKSQMQSQYQKDIQIYKPSFPAMVELKKQITDIEKQLREETKRINANAISELKSRYSSAQKKEQILLKELNKKKSELLKERKETTGLSALYREVETNRLMYDQLLQHMKEVSIAEGVTNSNISLIDEAFVPFIPRSPNIMRQLTLGVVLGLFLGTLFVFFRHFLDDKIRTAKDLETLSVFPVLGTIPFVKKKRKKATKDTALDFDAQSVMGKEAFHSLTTNLDYANEDGIPKILHITSARPSEGKSNTAVQLAKTMADNDHNSNVLLIDADLRKPVLGQYLDTEHHYTLSDYLKGSATLDDVVIESPVVNLSVITDKGAPCTAAKLLTGKRFIQLLDEARKQFDYIIIDSPPVLGLADALILANRSIATLFVVASGETRKPHLIDALKRLKLSYGNLNGFILTKSKLIDKKDYGVDYYYGDQDRSRNRARNGERRLLASSTPLS